MSKLILTPKAFKPLTLSAFWQLKFLSLGWFLVGIELCANEKNVKKRYEINL